MPKRSTPVPSDPREPDFDEIESLSNWPDQVFDQLEVSEPFPERIQLYSRGKAIQRGLIEPGHYGVPRGDYEIVDLGTAVEVLVIARRAKAVDLSDLSIPPTAVFDPAHPEFERIRFESTDPETGCMYGTEFLLFERTTKKLYEFFLGTRLSRPLARTLSTFMPVTAAEVAAKRRGPRPRQPVAVTLYSEVVPINGYSVRFARARISQKNIEWPPPLPGFAGVVVEFLNPKNCVSSRTQVPPPTCPLSTLMSTLQPKS